MKHSKKKKQRLNILRIVLLCIVALIFGISVYAWNAKNLMGNKMPMPFGYGVSVVKTGSMEPRLSENDLIFVKDTGDYEVNDIVVFQDNGSLIVHRIVEVNGDEIITQGDANNMADAPISKDDIKGELVWDVPYAGLAVKFLKQPIAIILILGLAVFLMERSFRKEKEQDTDEIKAIMEEIKKLKEEESREGG